VWIPPIALAAYTALLVVSAPRWPDDWDGIGFVESIGDFDLAAFRPHPPGYPVYVALLRVAAVVTRAAWPACVLVAAASGAAAVGFAWSALRRAADARTAWLGAMLVAFAPLCWRASSGVGSEAPALAFAFACAWGLGRPASRSAALSVGIGAGLGLGIRLSWAPLFLALLVVVPRRLRATAWSAAAVTCAGWAVPLVTIVGPGRLHALYATHFAGHSERWGGTILTEPGFVRIAWLARDVLCDGLGVGGDALGLVLGAVLATAAVLALDEWRKAGWAGGWQVAVVVPYALWVLLGQNLREQPRHVLPLVAALACALALCARRSTRLQAAAAALVALAAFRTARDAQARHSIPPPGQQLVDLALSQPAPERLAVFGVSSVRFFETSDLAARAFPAGTLGEVEMRLTRMDRLPSRVWVTSEVGGVSQSPQKQPLSRATTLCRPPRIDRRSPCIDVYEWKLRYLPAE
jgi:hypothetical protein